MGYPGLQGGQRLKDGDGPKLHPTQKPVELRRRVILSASKEGDLILDPVAGTGTTGCVARALGRDFVMAEANADYVAGIERRFAEPLQLDESGQLGEKEREKAEGYLKMG